VARSPPSVHDPGALEPRDRAQQTAQALKRKFKVVDDLAPGATVSAVLAAAGWPDSREAVLVVGHQPTMGEVAALLLTISSSAGAFARAPCGGFQSRPRWRASTVLKVVISPDSSAFHQAVTRRA
jgi:phosphohistidine phosphatase